MQQNNINTFAENVNKLVKNTNIALETLTSLNESLVTTNDTVSVSVPSDDGSISTFKIPSYNSVINKLNTTTNTVSTFVNGNGIAETLDGTYRQIKATPIPIAPNVVGTIEAPTTFSINNNWFFEDLMFPKLSVSLDLKDNIDNNSDRVLINRLILDTTIPQNLTFFNENIVGNSLSYYDVISLLTNNKISYYEDIETIDLPLTYEEYTGTFNVTDIKIINGNEWLYLDTLEYGLVNSNGIIINNYTLSINSQLKYNETIYNITDINISEKRIRITASIGIDIPGIGSTFTMYNEPFKNKIVNIGIGYDEANIIFIKGVNENYNLLSNEWSNGIAFYTNDLIYDENTNITLVDYYSSNVIDFGKKMLEEAKEKTITAYSGIIPNKPLLNVDYFKVVQINTQINASLDTESIKNTQTQIDTTKSNIESLKNTIAQQKAELVSTTNESTRKKIEQQISSNTSTLNVKQVEYNSLIKYLISIAYENSAVLSNPKYRIRGFFPIPDPQISEDGTVQNIISFDIAYRYLKLDDTGTSLNTFSYNDPSTNQKITGVYTDWNIVHNNVLQKTYDPSLGVYVWTNESVSNGDVVNINQIDIPITKGEKVEIRVRSISEAGYPINPLKSDWSDSVIIDFPSNLETSDQVKNILDDATNEQTNILLDQTLSSVGVYTHLSDSIPNPNSVNDTYYKHEAKYIAYNKNEDNVVTTINVQDAIDNVFNNTSGNISIIDPDSYDESGNINDTSISYMTTTLKQVINELIRINRKNINKNNLILK